MKRDLHWRRLAREAGAAHAAADYFAARAARCWADAERGFGDSSWWHAEGYGIWESELRAAARTLDAEARASYTALLGRAP